MSDLTRFDAAALDRHITGNYGEDQFNGEPESFAALQCDDCEHIFTDDDAGGPVYECGECGNTFTREEADDSNRCPNDGRFAAKSADRSCPECNSGELTEIDAYECGECGDLVNLADAAEHAAAEHGAGDEEPATDGEHDATVSRGRPKCSECALLADRDSPQCFMHRPRYGVIEVHARPRGGTHIVPPAAPFSAAAAADVTDAAILIGADSLAFSIATRGAPCECGGQDTARAYVGIQRLRRGGSFEYEIADTSRFASIDASGIKV